MREAFTFLIIIRCKIYFCDAKVIWFFYCIMLFFRFFCFSRINLKGAFFLSITLGNGYCRSCKKVSIPVLRNIVLEAKTLFCLRNCGHVSQYWLDNLRPVSFIGEIHTRFNVHYWYSYWYCMKFMEIVLSINKIQYSFIESCS